MERIKELIARHLKGELSVEEQLELEAWAGAAPRNRALLDEITDPAALAKSFQLLDKLHKEEVWARLEKYSDEKSVPSKEKAAVPVRRFFPYKWVAAAAAVLLFAGISYFLKLQNKLQPTQPRQIATIHDVAAPSVVRASIRLASGQTLLLDTAVTGTIATQGNTQIIKTAQGSIAYNSASSNPNATTNPNANTNPAATQFATLYNTLTNPRGSRVVSIALTDGTKVWLNAGSSLKYPSAFMGTERKVEITGEAYFEVAHNAAMPFKVTKNNLEVAVLGTHFNVSTYDDDPNIKVTLLEGAVKITNNKNAALLKPGDQGIIATQQINDKILVAKNTDLDAVMAWKNNRFDFGDKATIETVMRQISRWYDVDVSYNGTITSHFGGSISRDENISEVLKVLEASGGIKYEIEGRKITVKP